MIEISFYVIVALLIGSNAYWALVCLKLTNRLMSRNFAEYTQAVRPVKALKPVPEDMSDPVAERNARDMNAMIGVI